MQTKSASRRDLGIRPGMSKKLVKQDFPAPMLKQYGFCHESVYASSIKKFAGGWMLLEDKNQFRHQATLRLHRGTSRLQESCLFSQLSLDVNPRENTIFALRP